MAVSVHKVSNFVGAHVSGINLADLNDSDFAQIRKALFEHGVIFFRDQTLSEQEHISFAERWGEIDINRFFNAVSDYPKIAEVRTSPEQKTVTGGSWHSDHSYDHKPAMASILCARELPKFGGDTMFASMAAAYDHLSIGLKKVLENLYAWHDDASFAIAEQEGRLSADGITKPVQQPVIVRHPETGVKALYVNGDFTTHFVDWTADESEALLSYLYQAATLPKFCCRFRWRPGSVAMWDNRLVQHLAVDDYLGQSRLMHRITIKGVALA